MEITAKIKKQYELVKAEKLLGKHGIVLDKQIKDKIKAEKVR